MVTQQQIREKLKYPEVTDNIYLTVIMSFFMFFMLFFSMGTEARSGPGGVTLYVLMTIIVLVLGVNESRKRGGDLDSFIRVFGFDQPISGYNISLGVIGLGLAIWAYRFATELAAVAPGNEAVTSAAFPLYNAYTAFPNEAAVTLTLVEISAVSLYHFVVVAPNEEIWVNMMTKNISNWWISLSERNVPVLGLIAENINPYAMVLLAFMLARSIWVSWHWFSWVGLTIFSIMTGLAYGIIFYLPYFLTDYIGILTPEQKFNWDNPQLSSAVTSHGMWNTLVTIGGLGLGFTADMVLGAVLIIVPIIAMYLIRNYKTPDIIP